MEMDLILITGKILYFVMILKVHVVTIIEGNGNSTSCKYVGGNVNLPIKSCNEICLAISRLGDEFRQIFCL